MSDSKVNKRSVLSNIIYFFPLQLLFVHVKKNLQLLLFWLVLFLAVYKQIGLKYGIPYLFLAPEYLGYVSFSSYFIVGFALGAFAMAFNLSSYIMNGFRFPFLATLSKPFLKYAINNSIIPLLFIITYSIETYQFLDQKENFQFGEIAYRLSGFYIGYLVFVACSMAYFLATNKSFEKLFGKEVAKILHSDKEIDEPTSNLLNKKKPSWYGKESDFKHWRIDTYLSSRFRFRFTRSYKHYDDDMLKQVFRQNHINASRFEIFIILSIIILGIFRESDVFIIPAGATIILLFTMLLMVSSAIRSWMYGWTFPLLIFLFILFNQISKYSDFYYQNQAYGLDYSNKVDYLNSHKKIDPNQIRKDKAKTYQMLDHWISNNQHGEQKPKAVFFAASGGGSRAALWSFLALQHLDSISDGLLTKRSIMGTGSSGGMLGASYFRELKLRQQFENLNPYEAKYKPDLGKDILNPVVFTMTVNDALIRTQKFEYEGTKHWKDRAYIFEKTLLENTRGLLDKSLGDYAEAEQKAIIPTLIFSPSIVNDGRRMLISTLPLSFMTLDSEMSSIENVDYLTFFKDNSPLSTRFTSVLRMNSSFPYIMPTVNMPTEPSTTVFDSGLRDNYGIKTLLNYIFHLKAWLEENTSGIVILQIRDGLKAKNDISTTKEQSVISEILSPFGSLYGNWFEVQDYNNEELLNYTKAWFDGEIDIINYQLNKSPNNYISLSWHLTSKEKERIINSLTLAENKEAEIKLIELLNTNKDD